MLLSFFCNFSKNIYQVKKLLTSREVTRLYLEMPPKRKSTGSTVDGEPKVKKGRKSSASNETESKEEPDTKKSKKEKDNANKKVKAKLQKQGSNREAIPDVYKLDFTNDSKTPSGQKWNMKFASWNVNGLRAWLDKNGHSYIGAESADIFCVQETKCDLESLPGEREVDGYTSYWLSGDKDGYSGTGLYSKKKPINVNFGINNKAHDSEGRVITAEYEKFYFVTAYVPNSGRGLVRHNYRTENWDPAFLSYLKGLDAKKPVIMCGDLNVAHQEIDLANPKSNRKTAGFTDEERENFGKLLDSEFIDSFRTLYPDKEQTYSYWTYMMNARSRNIGWRLDYFVLSKRLQSHLCDSVMRSGVFGSDHCPIVCFMQL